MYSIYMYVSGEVWRMYMQLWSRYMYRTCLSP